MYPPAEPPLGFYYEKFLWVKFQDDLDVGLSVEGVPIDRSGGSLSGPQSQAVMEYIQSQGGRWERMIAVSEARADEWRTTAAFNGKTTADLNTYFHLWVGEEASAQDWLERLAELPEIAKLGRVPIPSLPTPPKYDSLQRYMTVVYPEDTAYSTARSIEADYAWQFLGGHGQGVTICDIEVDWNLDHADLPAPIPMWIPSGYCWLSPQSGQDQHGTANLGILGSRQNGFGTTGICRQARLVTAPAFIGTTGSCDASIFRLGAVLSMVIDSLDEGDIILLELQTALETLDSLPDSTIWTPIETYTVAYDLICTAVGQGIHVVEAAGNGGHDLQDVDADSIYINPGQWSGAIIVGAGSPGADVFDSMLSGGSIAYDAYYDTSSLAIVRSRYPKDIRSSYGPADTGSSARRVDVQAWGDRIIAPGYAEYYTQEGVNYYYTRWYGGTSGASPIVAGAMAILEGMWESYHNDSSLSPDSMRQLLRNTGIPQQGSDSLTHPIGPLPNLRMAIQGSLGSLSPCCVNKRGNVNGDTLNQVDLSDLSMLINYVDSPSVVTLLCPNAADVNASGVIDSNDVAVLIQYLVYRIDNRATCSLDPSVSKLKEKGGYYAACEDTLRCLLDCGNSRFSDYPCAC